MACGSWRLRFLCVAVLLPRACPFRPDARAHKEKFDLEALSEHSEPESLAKPCGLAVFSSLGAGASFGDARATVLTACEAAFPGALCSTAVADLWHDQDMASDFASASAAFCKKLHDAAELAARSALMEHSEALTAMDEAASRKVSAKSDELEDAHNITAKGRMTPWIPLPVTPDTCCGCESCSQYYFDNLAECRRLGKHYSTAYDHTCGWSTTCGACPEDPVMEPLPVTPEACCGCESCYSYYMDPANKCWESGKIYDSQKYDHTCGFSDTCGACPEDPVVETPVVDACCGCESCYSYYMDPANKCWESGKIYDSQKYDHTCGFSDTCGACPEDPIVETPVVETPVVETPVEDECCGCESCYRFYMKRIDKCTRRGKIYNASKYDSTCGLSESCGRCKGTKRK